MIDVMQQTHRQFIDARNAAERNSFLLRWPDLGRERLSYALSSIMSQKGPKINASGKAVI